MKKTIIWFIGLIISVITITGCSPIVNNQGNEATKNDEQIAQDETTSIDKDIQTNNDTVQEDVNKQANNQQSEELALSGTGIYVGQADSNFIEITINNSTQKSSEKVFMLSENIKNNFDSYNLKTGDNIKFEYQSNEHGQLVIYSLSKL